MNKKILTGVSLVALAIASCQLINKRKDDNAYAPANEQPSAVAQAKKKSLNEAAGILLESVKKAQEPKLSNQEHPPADPSHEEPAPSKEPVTQFDSKALDDRVIEEANLMHEDPKKYRMLVRKDSDGFKVFRMLGMHVMVTPNGEETFLPDEL
jgi:hypothetical protein